MSCWWKLVICTSLLCALPNAAGADVVIDWNNVLLDTIRTKSPSENPPRASRAMAMVHAAIYDAVNSISQTHQPYHVNMAADASASREAAAAQAAYQVLLGLYPANQSKYDTALAGSLGAIPDGPSKVAGVDLGMAVGNAILALRGSDHADDVVPYTPGSNPGDWNPTPPAMAPALLPGWGLVTPFAMTSGSQFRSATGPPELTSAEYTAYFNEVKEIGSATSATRTADQSAIAQFWADGGGTSTPPGHWNRIAQTIAEAKGNTLEENARMFALLNLGSADSAIACWDNKFTFHDWRPVTAIRNAELDGNPDTAADVNWSSYIPTPPFPSYTSGHSTFSGAAATILAEFFGTDDISFTSSAEGFAVADRSFDKLSEAAMEAMNSRLYGGIHWRYDNEDGLATGVALGQYIAGNFLQAVPEPTSAGLSVIMATLLLPLARRRLQSAA